MPQGGRDRLWPIPFWPIQFLGQYFWCHGGGPRAPNCGAPKGGGPKGGARSGILGPPPSPHPSGPPPLRAPTPPGSRDVSSNRPRNSFIQVSLRFGMTAPQTKRNLRHFSKEISQSIYFTQFCSTPFISSPLAVLLVPTLSDRLLSSTILNLNMILVCTSFHHTLAGLLFTLFPIRRSCFQPSFLPISVFNTVQLLCSRLRFCQRFLHLLGSFCSFRLLTTSLQSLAYHPGQRYKRYSLIRKPFRVRPVNRACGRKSSLRRVWHFTERVRPRESSELTSRRIWDFKNNHEAAGTDVWLKPKFSSSSDQPSRP